MAWRRPTWASCLAAAILAAAFLLGCGNKYPHGWVQLDVPAATVPTGWTAHSDAGSGISLAAPNGWIQWNRGDNTQINALTDAARHVPPGTSHAEMPGLPPGYNPSLFLVDTSPSSLQQMEFRYVCAVHMNAGRDLSIDLAESSLKKLSNNPLERVDLEIGPALKQTSETPISFSHGQSTTVRSVGYFMMHGSDLYVVRFTAFVDQFAALQPFIDQVMKTVRIGKPDPSAVAPSANESQQATNLLGGPDNGPPNADVPQQQAPPPQTVEPTQPQDQSQQTPPAQDNPPTSNEPPPQQDGTTGSTTPDPNAPGSTPPDQGQTTGSPGQGGTTGG